MNDLETGSLGTLIEPLSGRGAAAENGPENGSENSPENSPGDERELKGKP